MENCYWTLFSVMAGPTDTHFLYQWELVKDLFWPSVKNGNRFSRPRIGIKRPCPRPGHTKWATPILTHGPTNHEVCQHQFSDQPTWLVWDLVQLFTEFTWKPNCTEAVWWDTAQTNSSGDSQQCKRFVEAWSYLWSPWSVYQ